LDCCQCEGIERETKEWALEDLEDYRAGKLAQTTPMLIEALTGRGVEGRDLLDIGGGVGAVQLSLLAAGSPSAISVDASAAYLDVAREEAARKGLADRIKYLHGDFVSLASQVPEADIVTLDRVVCCYHDVRSLVSLSAARARRFYGLVYPRDEFWIRIGLAFENLTYRFKKSPFRAFVHSTRLVDRLIRDQGLVQVFQRRTWTWQVVLYERPTC
jgi:SAM-dependent methyltransferase